MKTECFAEQREMESSTTSTFCSSSRKYRTIPVDTVRLFTGDFRWNGQVDGWTTVSKDLDDGGAVRLRYHDPLTGWHVKLNATHHYLQLGGSLPKLLYTENGKGISSRQWLSAKTKLSTILNSLGISTVISELGVGRVDVFQDTDLPVRVAQLTNALNAMRSVDRLKNRSSKEFEDNYVRFENTRRCVVFYDKNRERGRGRSTNRLRCEVRLKRAGAVTANGLKRFEDLLDRCKLVKIWTTNVATVIERAKLTGALATDTGYASVAEGLIDLLADETSSIRDLVSFMASNGGVVAVTAMFGGRSSLDEALKVHLPDHKARRARRRIDELVGGSISLDEGGSDEKLVDFLDEWLCSVDTGSAEQDEEEVYEEE